MYRIPYSIAVSLSVKIRGARILGGGIDEAAVEQQEAETAQHRQALERHTQKYQKITAKLK